MTPNADGIPYEAYIGVGWSNQQLLDHELMCPFVSNEMFLKAIFGDSCTNALVTSFPDDPSNMDNKRSRICWSVGSYEDKQLIPNSNQYYCVSIFHLDERGKLKRQKALFKEQYCVVLDDVGEKLPIQQVEKLPQPSYKMLSSNNSEQWGYILEIPCADQARLHNLTDGLIKSNLVPNSKDPGMKGVTRLVRLPEGVNTKASRIAENGGKPPKCQITAWHPERKYSLEDLATPFDINLDALRVDCAIGINDSVDMPDHPILKLLNVKSSDGKGKIEVTCPWVYDHTGKADNGSVIFIKQDGSIGFKCHHGHCEQLQGHDVVKKLIQENSEFEQEYSTFKINIAFADVPLITPLDDAQSSFSLTSLNIDLSHTGLAAELGKQHFHENARYIHKYGRWFLWNGFHWKDDGKLQYMTLIGGLLKLIGDSLIKLADSRNNLSDDAYNKAIQWAKRESKNLKSAPTRNYVESVIKTDPNCAVLPEIFDANLSVIGTQSGCANLETGVLTPPARLQYISKLTNVGIIGKAPAEWLKFIDRIFDRDIELISFIQRVCGYALTGLIREEKLFFLYGKGANGKSKFLETLFYILGDYARRAPASLFQEQRNEQHPTVLAGLQGARLVVCSELPSQMTWNEQIIKDATGGDTITARYMRQDYFDFKPQFKLMIAGNHQPRMKNVDESMARRMVLIPFNVTIPKAERDLQLGEKLKAEAPAILNWCIQGAVDYFQNGLQIPAAVASASAEYLQNEDVTGEFIATYLRDAISKVHFAEVYQHYSNWQRAQGFNYFKPERAFKKELIERGMNINRSNGIWWLHGYEFSLHNATSCFTID